MSSSAWKKIFLEWPGAMSRRGVLVTSFDEQIVFTGFLTTQSHLLIERQAPDTQGARMVILPYENIAAVKIIDVVKSKTLQEFGFEGSLSKK